MGKHREGCEDNCSPKCNQRNGDKCKLYSCQECSGFLGTGDAVVRVVFKATKVMEARRQYLYGRGIHRNPLDTEAFVTYHKNCYIEQLIRWIDTQLERKDIIPDANIRV